MAGLGRAQQLFNHAVLGTLATLIGFARGDRQAETRLATQGHPLFAKYIKHNPPNKGTPGYEYPGYCYGTREIERRRRQIEEGRLTV